MFEIEIIDWESFNPRSDRGGFTWFRMSNQFFLDMRQRRGCSSDATVLMTFLLAEASAKDGRPFRFRLEYAGEILGWKADRVQSGLSELSEQHLVRFKPLQAASTLTDGRTDGRILLDGIEQKPDNEKAEPKFDLESVYRRFPRREGKSRGLKKLKSEIRTLADFEQLVVSVENYAASRRGEDPKFTKHFSTWVAEWRDWIEMPSVTTPVRIIDREAM